MELYNAMFRLCLIADCRLPVPMPLYVVCCMLLSDWLLDLSLCCKLALVNLGYLARSLIALIEPFQAEGKRRTIVVWQVDVGNTFNQQVHCCRITQQLGKKNQWLSFVAWPIIIEFDCYFQNQLHLLVPLHFKQKLQTRTNQSLLAWSLK